MHMSAPNFTSYEDYVRMTSIIDSFIKDESFKLELFGNPECKDVTESNEKQLAEFLRGVHMELGAKKRTNYKATMLSYTGEILFSGLFNYSCFNNFALLLWHSASHANVTFKKELEFQVKFVESLENSESYKSPYCWE